ncbi:MAG: imidazole glycerol phosphate synthase subunit HisH [Candidatus Binatia bacterium]|nr:imidazole glycerol phosphate synthase subunit HisH [Candidatus Binatia bacterium]MDG2008175.1 imidazole glycerol phosphate synthase subunit HisH [Candidatus Binatia bacterium]
MIAVVDYGVGNLRSAAKGLERAASEEGIEATVKVTSTASVLRDADAVVLPGVGAFGACMQSLLESGLLPAVREAASSGKPFLGICVGMQILFEESDEFGPVAGLGILPGRVERLQSVDVPIPHMGWNAIRLHGEAPIMRRTEDGTYFYFVHSYAAHPAKADQIVASVEYGGATVVAAVARDNIFGTQFHPEKSQGAGIRLLGDFVARL